MSDHRMCVCVPNRVCVAWHRVEPAAGVMNECSENHELCTNNGVFSYSKWSFLAQILHEFKVMDQNHGGFVRFHAKSRWFCTTNGDILLIKWLIYNKNRCYLMSSARGRCITRFRPAPTTRRSTEGARPRRRWATQPTFCTTMWLSGIRRTDRDGSRSRSWPGSSSASRPAALATPQVCIINAEFWIINDEFWINIDEFMPQSADMVIQRGEIQSKFALCT